MRIRIALILIVFGLAAVAVSQVAFQVPPQPSFEDYRPIGETRLWSFEVIRQNVGTLMSTVTKKTKFNDQVAFVLNEKLALDFKPAGSDVAIEITGDQYLSEKGYYLGSEQEQTINGQHSILTATRKDAIIEALTKSDAGETKQSQVLDPAGFVYDLFFLDQIELFFAMHGLEVGKTYTDTLFSPQPMLNVVFNGLVIDYNWIGLYTGHYDSCFVVNVSSPEPARLMITKNFRLVKADFVGRNLKVYLDAVRQNTSALQSSMSKLTLGRIVMLVPIIGVYLTIAGLLLMLLGWDGFKLEEPYVGLLIGAMIFALVPLAQYPIQSWIIRTIVAPTVQSGKIWLTALLPSLVAGLMQAIMLSGALIGLCRFKRMRSSSSIILGAFLGAGFGVAESSFLALTTATNLLFSWSLLERSAFIAFYVAAGALVGYGIAGNSRRLIKMVSFVILADLLLKYSPILVQQKVLQPELIYILLALMVLVFLVVTLVLIRQRRPVRSVQQATKQPAS